ncbi:MAG: TRAP transporter large permease [Oligoflexia bacterium]|nr:TRAP transporter large permease [Oligoflexia bacterium]
MTVAAIVLLVIFALLGVPLFMIMGAATMLGYFVADEYLSGLFIEVYKIATNPVLMAIPLFTFAGYLMAESGTPGRIIRLSRALIGWLPGGLAIVSLVTCAFFTAFTGASGVTIVAMGGLLLPVLVKEKYNEKFSVGLLTTTGSLGLLFPPSLPLILYAIIAGSAYSGLTDGIAITVDKLFVAALLPGILLIIALSIYGVIKGIKSDSEKHKFSAVKLVKAIKEAKWEIPLPIIVLTGIYSGFFTASEAAAITAFYILIVETVCYRDISFKKDLPGIIKEASILVGGIIIIIGMALAFTNYLIEEEIPQYLVGVMKELVSSRLVFLMLLNIFLLVVGCMMDIFSAILVVVPLIVPIAHEFGVHPLHLGVIFLTNLEIGYSTPPVGLNLFIASFRFKKPVVDLYKASIPYLLILLTCLMIITYVPEITLYLTR